MTAAVVVAFMCCVAPAPSAAAAAPVRPARQAVEADAWFASDKAKHFFSSAFLQSFSYSALRAAGAGHDAALGGAAGTVILVGSGKEFRDRRSGGRWSARDMAWNMAGAGAAALVLHRVRRS